MESPKDKRKYKRSKLKENPNSYLQFYGVAFEVVAFNLICIWGGYKLSERFSPNSYWILFLSVFFAMAGTIYYLLKRLNKWFEKIFGNLHCCIINSSIDLFSTQQILVFRLFTLPISYTCYLLFFAVISCSMDP